VAKKVQYAIKYRYKKDDLVRLSHLKHIFRRGYNQQFTGEVFKIAKRFHLQGIPLYKVKDFNDELIEGDFYEADLQKVKKEEDSLWLIEKIIKNRRRKGVEEVLVKFESWPSKFNQWIKKSDVIDLQSR
jgi:predicted CopG family antitoxin